MSEQETNMVVIVASDPDIIPATAEKVCDMWGVRSIVVGSLPRLPVEIELQKCHSDGVNVTWSSQPVQQIYFANLFDVARERPRIQQAINLLMEELAETLQEPAVAVPLPPSPEPAPSSSEPLQEGSEYVSV